MPSSTNNLRPPSGKTKSQSPSSPSNGPLPYPLGLTYPTISMITSHTLHHKFSLPAYTEEKKRCHWCQVSRWPTHDLYPISIVNQIPGDRSTIDPNFKFINENILGQGVELASSEYLTGCECADNEDCLEEKCTCLEELVLEGTDEGGKINAYSVQGDRRGCLRGEMLKSRKPIYECNEKCGCGPGCPNKVVSRGRKVPLQVFKTQNRGWGLRSTEDIKRGQFVGTYVGELLTSTSASARRSASTLTQKKDVYLFALDKFSDPTSNDPRLNGEPYEIDGEYFAGPTRFINHSCNPNLRIFAVVRDLANKPFHDLCFFALKEISRFEELTFDYTDGISGREGDAMEMEEEGMSRCLCGEENCRGMLW